MRISDWSSDVCSSDLYSLSFSPVLGTHLLPENEHVFNDAIPGVDITYGFRLDGEENTWADLLNAREVGLSFSFRDFSRLAGHLDTSADRKSTRLNSSH